MRKYREALEEAGAVLYVRRIGGADLRRWSRQSLAADVRKAELDRAWREAQGVEEGEDPESEAIIDAHRMAIFTEGFHRLEGFEDVDTAEKALEAIEDFLPFVGITHLWGLVMTAQEPSGPES